MPYIRAVTVCSTHICEIGEPARIC